MKTLNIPNEEQKGRYLQFIAALGIEIGDKLKIPGWFTYEVKEEGFLVEQDGFKKTCCHDFNILISRGYEIIKPSNNITLEKNIQNTKKEER